MFSYRRGIQEMKFKGKMSLKLDKGTIKFVNEYADLIDDNKFTELYNKALELGVNLNELGRMFYDAGIDPLEHMTEVPAQFFADNYDLLEITIPDHITRLCDSCFYDCTNVKEVIVPKSVTRIDEWALAGMDKLESITIEGKLESLHPFGIYELPLLEKIWTPLDNQDILVNNVSELSLDEKGKSQARLMAI